MEEYCGIIQAVLHFPLVSLQYPMRDIRAAEIYESEKRTLFAIPFTYPLQASLYLQISLDFT